MGTDCSGDPHFRRTAASGNGRYSVRWQRMLIRDGETECGGVNRENRRAVLHIDGGWKKRLATSCLS